MLTNINAEILLNALISLAIMIVVVIVETIRKKQAGYGKP